MGIIQWEWEWHIFTCKKYIGFEIIGHHELPASTTTATNTTAVALEVVSKLIAGLPEAPRTTEVHAESSTVSTCLLAIYFHSVTIQCTSLQMCVH